MARSRNIKPGFFKNELLPDIDFQGRLLFIGLWTLADRKGRLEYRPRRIKGELFPYEECDVESYVNALSDMNFLQVYEINNNHYIQIVSFEKHQNPHVKEAESTIPAPVEHGASTADSLNLIPDSLNPIDAQTTFTRFWDVYPKKRDKQKAYEVWKRKNLKNKVDEIVTDVQLRIEHDKMWLKDFPTFVPYPSKYLRNSLWEDECEMPK